MSVIFSQFEIGNFRGIRHCEAKGLGDVNLFFGKNNSGKSSLLEALFLLTGPSNPAMPLVVNNLRGLHSLTEENLLVDFYQANADNHIRLTAFGEQHYRNVVVKMAENEKSELRLQGNPQLSATDNRSKNFGINITFEVDHSGKTYQTCLTTQDGIKGTTIVDKSYREAIFSQYIPSSMPYNDTEKLHRLFQEKEEGFLLKALRAIEPRVKDIVLSGDALMVDVGMPTRLPINVLGDGVRKVVSLVVAVMNCQGGILLVDEIENGLHFSTMERLWEIIINAVRRKRVQLFASTHSYDMLKALSRAGNKITDEAVDVSAYKLMHREEGEICVLAYSQQDFAYAMEQNMEVR